MAKIWKMGHILDAISPTDFILGTKVQPNNAHSMTQVPMTLTFSQGQIFPKMGKIPKNWSYLKRLFHLQTSYLVPSYNPIRCIQWPKCRWPLPKWIKNQRTVHFSEAISHDIYYHSFLWLIWALPSCFDYWLNDGICYVKSNVWLWLFMILCCSF